MKFRPLHDRVLIKVLDSDEKTAGGIIIPDTAKEKPQKGKVIAAGAGRINDDGKTIALTVKNGDEVIYSKYAGTEYSENGKEYLIVRESDILAIVG